MKSLFLPFFLVLTMGLPALDLRVGPLTSGWNTFAGELIAEGPPNWPADDLRPEAGLEAGFAGGSPQVLVPLGLMWESYLETGWSSGAAVHGLAGAALGSSRTDLVWGGEGELRAEWSWSPGIGLGLALGVRYTVPGNQPAVLEFPLHLTAEFAVGGADTLEPVDNEAKEKSAK